MTITTEASPILRLGPYDNQNTPPSSADAIDQESRVEDEVADALAMIPPLEWSNHHKNKVWGLLSCISALFADTSYVPLVSIWHPTCLLFFTFSIWTQGRNCDTIMSCCFVTMVVLLRAVPAMDYFYFETTRILAYLTALTIVMSIYLWTIAVTWIHFKCWYKAAAEGDATTRNIASLALPVLLTALFQVLGRFSPIGGVGNPAMGLTRVAGIRQVASLVGEVGLVFWISWCAVVIVNRRCSRVFVHTTVVLLLYGSVRESTGHGFYLQDITKWQVSQAVPLRISCLTRARNSSTADIVSRTNTRLVAGDDLIVWSESATIITDEHFGMYDLFDWEAASSQSVVVATRLQQNGTDQFYNTVEMFQVNRESLRRYDKNRPVPVVEANILAGRARPTPFPVTFTPEKIVNGVPTRTNVTLLVAMIICFDLDLPTLVGVHGRRTS